MWRISPWFLPVASECGTDARLNLSTQKRQGQNVRSSSPTYQVGSLTLEDPSVVPASSAERPDDRRGDHASGTTAGDRDKST